MATFEQQLKQVKNDYNDARNEEIRLQTRMDEAKKRRKEAVQKVKDKGLSIKELPKTIKEKEKQLEETFEEINKHLPSEDEGEDFEY